MILALAFGVVLMSGSPSAGPSHDGVVQLLREACVETGMDRTAFERLGRERRWRPVRMTGNTGPGWLVSFRTDGAVLMLTGDPAEANGRSSTGVMCAVSVDHARDDLLADVEAFATDLGLEADPQAEGFGGSETRTWSRFGDRTMTYAFRPSDPRAVVSLSRQTVTAGE